MPNFKMQELLSRADKWFAQGRAAHQRWRWEQNAGFFSSGLDIVQLLIKITPYVEEMDILPQGDLRLFRNWHDWLNTFQNQGSFPLNWDNRTIHNKSFIWQISFLLLPSRSQRSQIYFLSDKIWQSFLPYFYLLLSLEILWFFLWCLYMVVIC